MGPVAVVEVFELSQRVQRVALIPNRGVIEEFSATRLYAAFDDCVQAGHSDAAEYDGDSGVSEHSVEPAAAKQLASWFWIMNRA
jgi:hypothetical protein